MIQLVLNKVPERKRPPKGGRPRRRRLRVLPLSVPVSFQLSFFFCFFFRSCRRLRRLRSRVLPCALLRLAISRSLFFTGKDKAYGLRANHIEGLPQGSRQGLERQGLAEALAVPFSSPGAGSVFSGAVPFAIHCLRFLLCSLSFFFSVCFSVFVAACVGPGPRRFSVLFFA